jgi:hypothetical protein
MAWKESDRQIWAQRPRLAITGRCLRSGAAAISTLAADAQTDPRRSGGQGVASSNLASPMNTLHAIRPSRTCNQQTFLPPSMTPSGGAATSPISRVGYVISPMRCMRPPPIQRRGRDSRGPRR